MRAECLCTELFKIGLASCCAIPATELSSANNETLASPRKCCSTASHESTKRLAPETAAGDQRACPRTRCSPKACYSSSPSVQTCCSDPPGVKSIQSDNSAPTPRFGCPSGSSNQTRQPPTAQHGTFSEDSRSTSDHQSLTPAAIDLEKGSAVEYAVT